MSQIFNYTQFLFIALFMGAAVASWVYGEIRRQAARKRAKAEARRRYEEQLRTGRAPEEPSTGVVRASPKQSPAQRLAAQRQAQLQQLRQRQSTPPGQARGPQSPPSSSPASAPLVRSSRTPMARPTGRPPSGVVIQRVPPSSPTPTSRPKPPQVRRPTSPLQRPGRPSRLVQTPQTRAPQPRASARQDQPPQSERRQRPRRSPDRIAAPVVESTQRRAPDDTLRQDVRALLLGHSGSRADRSSALRTLIAATEVLAPPVSMRDQQGWTGAQT